MAPELTPVGELLEQARGEMSKREAARRAGISEGRWRQIVTGRQTAGGVDVPVNPRRETVIAMARAVKAPVADALLAAGFTPGPDLHYPGDVTVVLDDQDADNEIRYQRPDGISDEDWRQIKRAARATIRGLFEEYET